MMMKTRGGSLLRIIALAGISWLAAGYGVARAESAPPADHIEAGILIESAPPFVFKENGQFKGITYDILKTIAARRHFRIAQDPMGFDAMIPAMQSSQIDVAVAGFFVTPERKKIIDFSTPFFQEGSVLVVPVNSPIKRYADLEGKVVVTQQGSAALNVLNKLAPQYHITVKALADQANILLTLQSGNADAAFYDSAIIEYLIAKQGKHPSLRTVGDVRDPTDIAFALPKGSKWTPLLSDEITAMKKSGELKTIIGRYIKD
ncbi:substrate-binding periplasmic protein [Martelella alba]|uniref:Amino acid ABC transporter substrate-binding protein n=1 Tax=Martelella alba TaxID=2590451 RepID=A0ABY2SNE9_9HYPH|nr:ABC transporter substrate-binding protein [Martelella alba]TKI06595.1 amino acid ABC transporter substrate-binding protein [Martelella alba]